jgi:ribosomal protein L11 methyltransferase
MVQLLLAVLKFGHAHRYLWRKHASDAWLRAHETELLARFAERVAFIERAGRQRTIVEICFATRHDAGEFAKSFGGHFHRISRTPSLPSYKPIRVGARLIIMNGGGALAPRLATNTAPGHKGPSHISPGPRHLVIPAAGAFGTGEHATTAMSLRMLERVTRPWGNGWSILDAGTGSGILALAARCFRAKDVTAIDNDPQAVAIAKSNARLNRVRGVRFEVADARRFKPSRKVNVIAANLFSELLIATIPKWIPQLRSGGILILSGVLLTQEGEVMRALAREGVAIEGIRRRGKWVAILARN